MKKIVSLCILVMLLVSFTVPASAISRQTDYSYLTNRNVDTIKHLDNGSISVSLKNRKGTYGYIAIEHGSDDVRIYQIPTGKVVRLPLMFGKGNYHIFLGYSKSLSQDQTFNVVKEKKLVSKLAHPTPYTLVVLGKKSPEIQSLLQTKFKDWRKWTPKERVVKVSNYLTSTYYYSNALASYTDTHWYTPDYKARMKDKGIICYDVAALTASLLRSMDVPTRFLGGYWKGEKQTYHAWNQVFVKGKWVTVDNTFDLPIKMGNDWAYPQEPIFENGKEYIIEESF